MISEISSIIGLRVYTDEGRYVGKVEDLVIDMEKKIITGIAMIEYNRTLIDKKSGVIIPYRLVKSVGDIVIVKDVFKKKKEKEEEKRAKISF